MKKPTNNIQLSLGLMLSIALVLNGCTSKTREAALPEGDEKNVFAISDFKGTEFIVGTDDSVEESSTNVGLKAAGEKPTLKIKSTNAPERLQFATKNLKISGKPGSQYPIRFSINSKSVIGYKVVANAQELSVMEAQVAKPLTGANKNEITYLIPIMKYDVKEFGIIERVKNENKEKTANLKLEPTDWSGATHVKIDTLERSRLQPIGVENTKELFLVEKIDGKIKSGADVESTLNLDIALDSKDQYYTKLGSGGLLIYKITQKSELSKEIAIDDLQVKSCPADVLATLAAELHKDCVLALSYTAEVSFPKVKMKTVTDSEGQLVENGEIELDQKGGFSKTGLVQIAENTQVRRYMMDDILDPKTTLKIANLKGKEYFFRRTVEDAANSSTFMPTGFSGDTEIVNFDFEESRVVVRKVNALLDSNNISKIDREVLMSIPVYYFNLVRYDSAGRMLAIPKLEKAPYDKAEYVYLDWTRNELPIVNSPLSYVAGGDCIASVANEKIVDMDNRLFSDGVISFSISSSAAIHPRMDCYNSYSVTDYWYGSRGQLVYSAKERVSFRENKGENDNSNNITLPFAAQNLLNFGGFTLANRKADTENNFGFDGQETSHPVIYNFNNGRTLTYILGGLPESGREREVMIRATQQVIKDWNASFHISFKGTSLERKGDYVKLQIDGVDAPKGNLGDLDKSYIWYYGKAITGGPLGLAQASPNPRSGVVESMNVLMYGGNILSYIANEQRVAKALKAYEARKALVLETLIQEEQAKLAKDKAAAEEAMAEVQALAEQAGMAAGGTPNAVSDLSLLKVQNNLHSANKTDLKKLKDSGVFTNKHKLSSVNLGDKAFIKNIFEKALANNIMNNESELTQLATQELLRAHGDKITALQKEALAIKIQENALLAKFKKHFSSRPGCFTESRVANGAATDLAETDLMVLLESQLKQTLAHEIGHTVGLTHNFKGSVDKANFKYDEDKKQVSEYSTVMDYLATEVDTNYQGLGAYDQYAIRALYTGLIELSQESIDFIKSNNFSQILVADKYLHVDQLKSLMKIDSWLKFTPQKASSFVLKAKNIMYCTDKDISWEPLCQRWDRGTSATEVAQNMVNDYKSMYVWKNSDQNRIRFGYDRYGSYIGRLVNDMNNLRQFMDETFFHLVKGSKQEIIQDYGTAAITGWYHFNEIIRTPTTNLRFADNNRFSLLNYKYQEFDDKNQPVGAPKSAQHLVESKAAQDLWSDTNNERMDTMGIEYDKLIALMTLTQRDSGHPKYAQMSLNFSYLDFEKYGLQIQNLDESLTLSTLTEVLLGDLSALTMTPHGLRAVSGAKVEINESLRYYSILSGVVFSAADTLVAKDNFANLFSIGGAINNNNVPKDRVIITELGVSPTSQTAMKYWATDNASISDILLEKVARTQAVINSEEEITNGFKAVLKTMLEDQSVPDSERSIKFELPSNEPMQKIIVALTQKEHAAVRETVKAIERANKSNLIISKEAIKEEPKAVLYYVLAQRYFFAGEMSLFAEVRDLLAKGNKIEALVPSLQNIGAQNTDLVERAPLAIASQNAIRDYLMESITANNDPMLVVAQLLYSADLTNSIADVMSNIKYMNSFYYMMNPDRKP